MQNLASSPAPPAGLLRRLGALCYDSVLLVGILFLATAALLPFKAGEALLAHKLAYRCFLLGIIFFFFGWFWTHGGQTLGMRAWKIRLSAETGCPLNWAQAALRFSAGLLSIALFGLGFLWGLVDPDRRCLHDRVARTRMTRVP